MAFNAQILKEVSEDINHISDLALKHGGLNILDRVNRLSNNLQTVINFCAKADLPKPPSNPTPDDTKETPEGKGKEEEAPQNAQPEQKPAKSKK